MMSSQDALGKLDAAMRGIRSAQDALGQVAGADVPRVTIDGIQHELTELEQRLRALRDDLVPAGKQSSSDQE